MRRFTLFSCACPSNLAGKLPDFCTPTDDPVLLPRRGCGSAIPRNNQGKCVYRLSSRGCHVLKHTHKNCLHFDEFGPARKRRFELAPAILKIARPVDNPCPGPVLLLGTLNLLSPLFGNGQITSTKQGFLFVNQSSQHSTPRLPSHLTKYLV